MIQRIQSVFLIIAFGLIISFILLPIVTISGSNNLPAALSVFRVNTPSGSEMGHVLFQLTRILGFIAAFAVLVAIFVYKNRSLQRRICFYTIIGLLLTCLLTIAGLWALLNIQGVVLTYKLALPLPVIALIFVFLAERRIKKDDDLVRSLDRIR